MKIFKSNLSKLNHSILLNKFNLNTKINLLNFNLFPFSYKSGIDDKSSSHPFATDGLNNNLSQDSGHETYHSHNNYQGTEENVHHNDHSHHAHEDHLHDNFYDNHMDPLLFTKLKKKFNPLKYSRKLTKRERIDENKEVTLYDNINEPNVRFNESRMHLYKEKYLSDCKSKI